MLLKGLEIAPSQICGSIRIVPLIRRNIRGDLRLQRHSYDTKYSIVCLDSDMQYMSYIPHGMIMSWSEDGSAVGNIGADILKKDAKSRYNTQVLQRMV